MEDFNFLSLFNNPNFKKMISEMLENSMIYDKPKNTTLYECLSIMSDEYLENCCKVLKIFNKNIKKAPIGRDKQIEYLEVQIPSVFKDSLNNFLTLDSRNKLDRIIKKIDGDNFDIYLLMTGFVYLIKDNKKETFIVPNELVKIYNTYLESFEKKEIDKTRIIEILYCYSLINGIVEIDFLVDLIINHYHFDFTEEEIKDIAENELGLIIYKDKYYSIFETLGDNEDEAIKLLEKSGQGNRYMILNEIVVYTYLDYYRNLSDKVLKIIGNQELADMILNVMFYFYDEDNEFLNNVLSNFKIKNNKKLLELINQEKDNFRYWFFGGRTYDEFLQYMAICDNLLNKKPKSLDLKTCLKSLKKNSLDELYSEYDVKNLDELEKMYLEDLECTLEDYEIFDILTFYKSTDTPVEDLESKATEILEFLFYYQDQDETKVIIPEEIDDLFEKEMKRRSINNGSLNNELKDDKETIATSYIYMNGVLEKKKLQELIKDYHDIEISIEELDEIARDNDYNIIDNYYTSFDDITKNDLEEILKTKAKVSSYKKVDFDQLDKDMEFKEKLEELLDDCNEIFDIIITATSSGTFSDQVLDFIKEEYNISAKLARNILELYKQYKKYISCWNLNGYSSIEYQELNIKPKKIGRNEKCPCGSGKKYKNCCLNK